MEFKQIQELIKQVNKSNISEVKIKEGEFELILRSKEYIEAVKSPKGSNVAVQQPVAQPAPAPTTQPSPPQQEDAPQQEATGKKEAKADEESQYITVKSPMIGTFYRSPAPDKEAFVQVGDMVKKGDVLCIIEAMKLFNEIESELEGKVVKVLVEDSSPVEYDQPLFLLDPKA